MQEDVKEECAGLYAAQDRKTRGPLYPHGAPGGPLRRLRGSSKEKRNKFDIGIAGIGIGIGGSGSGSGSGGGLVRSGGLRGSSKRGSSVGIYFCSSLLQ